MVEGLRAHLEWGVSGSKRAVARGDVVVVVDVFSFCTTVVAAVSRGAIIYPYRGLNPESYARQVGAEVARRGSYSLSSTTFEKAEPGLKVVLPSANGSTITMYVARSCPVYAGALVNASAASRAAARAAAERNSGLTVIAGGERPLDRWQDERSYEFRPAIEDLLAAGAILSVLPASWELTPEATLALLTYEAAKPRLKELIWECESALEIRADGRDRDVEFASRVDSFDLAPLFSEGAFRPAPGQPDGP
ncbi:MAG: 2-phosphosulfolactate phosphatase [Dehalococcoidia bacterium]